MKRWIAKYDYCGNVEVDESVVVPGRYIKFTARTTKTRASSMVTRIRHIVSDVIQDRTFEVTKQLEGDAPKTRADLASWSIIIFFPTRTGRRAA